MKTTFPDDDRDDREDGDRDNAQDDDPDQEVEPDERPRIRRSTLDLGDILSPGLQGSIAEMGAESLGSIHDRFFKQQNDALRDQIASKLDIAIPTPAAMGILNGLPKIPAPPNVVDLLGESLKSPGFLGNIPMGLHQDLSETFSTLFTANASDSVSRIMPYLRDYVPPTDISGQLAHIMGKVGTGGSINAPYGILQESLRIPDSLFESLDKTFDIYNVQSVDDALRVAQARPDVKETAEKAVEEQPEAVDELAKTVTGHSLGELRSLTRREVIVFAGAIFNVVGGTVAAGITASSAPVMLLIICIALVSYGFTVESIKAGVDERHREAEKPGGE